MCVSLLETYSCLELLEKHPELNLWPPGLTSDTQLVPVCLPRHRRQLFIEIQQYFHEDGTYAHLPCPGVIARKQICCCCCCCWFAMGTVVRPSCINRPNSAKSLAVGKRRMVNVFSFFRCLHTVGLLTIWPIKPMPLATYTKVFFVEQAEEENQAGIE